jgi:hypothetical protein
MCLCGAGLLLTFDDAVNKASQSETPTKVATISPTEQAQQTLMSQ